LGGLVAKIGRASSDRNKAKARRGMPRGARLFVRDILLILVAAIVISLGIKTFLIRTFYIPSGSMMNTLQINDRIIVDELVPDVIPVQQGDVVVFTDPGGWLAGEPTLKQPGGIVGAFDWALSLVGLTSRDSNNHLVKRVIGLPGDRVRCCNDLGQMSVNGIPLVEPYLDLPTGVTKVSKDDFRVTVPTDSYWVMGDNRYDSRDSRYNTAGPTKGFVPKTDIVGRAFVISWPVNRWTFLDDYPKVFSGVSSTTK
jgi:signal peptidase I